MAGIVIENMEGGGRMNLVMRHAVNRSVTARIKTSAGAYARFYDISHDEDFGDKLNLSRIA